VDANLANVDVKLVSTTSTCFIPMFYFEVQTAI
jgi:hypothetical protein